MTEIDFAVAFLLIISVLTYSIVSVSNKLSNDFNLFTEKKLEESASSFSKQLLKIQDEKSLISSFKKIQASFQEIGSYSHTESLSITITPLVDKIHVYDNYLNEIPSTVSNNVDNVTISFNLDFLTNEKKYVNIFYDGTSSNIAYTSDENNITSTILSEEDVYILSQQRCSGLKALSYEETRDKFGLLDNFNISECDHGYTAPDTANVIVKSVPVLIEKSDGTLYLDFVRVKVW
jgi:light-regulated signal transduction histidine kinase (bacteriophytochrome)